MGKWFQQITRQQHSGFWPILAQMCFGFSVGEFSILWGNSSHIQGSISNAGGTFEPKNLDLPYNPPFWPKSDLGGQICLAIFVKRLIKYSESKKTDCKNLFSSCRVIC